MEEIGRLKLISVCRDNGLQLTDEQVEKLTAYVKQLLEWNSRVNLISRADTANVWAHVLHSLSILLALQLPSGIRVLDLGTGGGLPGLPLAIVRGDIGFTLLDSVRKKTLAVQDMVSQLAITNVQVVNARAEKLSSDVAGKGFDSILARGVASLTELVKWSLPLVRRNRPSEMHGDQINRKVLRLPSLVALKGGDLVQEIQQAKTKLKLKGVSVVDLNFEGIEEAGLSEKKIVIVSL